MTGDSDADQPRTREDLMRLITSAVRANITYIDEDHARAIADTILRRFRAAGLAIVRRRRPEGRQ